MARRGRGGVKLCISFPSRGAGGQDFIFFNFWASWGFLQTSRALLEGGPRDRNSIVDTTLGAHAVHTA